MKPYTQNPGLINTTSHPPNLNQVLLQASQSNTLKFPLKLLPPLSRQIGGGEGLEACGATIHLMSSPAGTRPLRWGGGDRLPPRLVHHLPLGKWGKASPQRGSVGSTSATAALDTPHGVCHPRTWETGAALGHGTEALPQFRDKPAAHTILGRRSMYKSERRVF